MQSYCLKCKGKREIINGSESISEKSNRKQYRGKCPDCDSTLVRMLKGDPKPEGEKVPRVKKVKDVKFEDEQVEQVGGLNPVAILSGVAGVTSVANSLGLLTPLKELVASLVSELEYAIVNPAAGKWKNIYVHKLPNLALKYDLLGNDIAFLQRKKETKTSLAKINRWERKRADILSLAKKLLLQLPRFKEMAEAKDEQLQAKEAQKALKEINNLESKLNTLKGSGIEQKKKVVSMEDN